MAPGLKICCFISLPVISPLISHPFAKKFRGLEPKNPHLIKAQTGRLEAPLSCSRLPSVTVAQIIPFGKR
jgi:hypothetical protein